MNLFQNFHFAYGCPPVDTNGAAISAASGFASYDTLNSGRPPAKLNVLVGVGNIAANQSAGTFLIQESDDDSSYSTVSGLTFTDLTAASSDNKLFGASFPLGGARKRYYKVMFTGGAGATLIFAVFIAESLSQAPTTATHRGLTEHLIITS